jgi:hypothetical protein
MVWGRRAGSILLALMLLVPQLGITAQPSRSSAAWPEASREDPLKDPNHDGRERRR